MRIVPFIISTLITVALIIALDKRWGAVPAMGRFLSPQHGFWQNAEPADHDFNESLAFPDLKGNAKVYMDERLVPHVFAENEEDAYFIQGFLHAKFRLWQMEFQTLAAAGRVSEKLGNDPRFLRFDREQRRLGMAYAAENALKEMDKDPLTKSYTSAYTAGVNAYINSLTDAQLPIEYKLLGYKPEPWSNMKVALFLKQMSKTLAGFDRDLEYTNAKSVFNADEIKNLFPQVHDSLLPIVPKGTVFAAPGITPVKPATADSLYFEKDTTIQVKEVFKPNPQNGSNNWAVSGTKTASGAPILCNDPHLELSLPSIWYEMQLHTPTMNAYGATFPGSPSIIIGFNDNIAFGFTNAQRDVKDYYAIRFKDDSKKEYWYNGAWRPTTLRIETFKINGAPDFLDTVAYTHFGPVMYDESFTKEENGTKAIALRWTAHDPSNEGLMWFKLNRAKNYADYEDAIRMFCTPGQNMIFASKSGDIALWQQAKFPARWEGQGLYIMPGEDSSYEWQGFIPQAENPHVINPVSGYIESANQRPVDSSYPYFIPGNYITARGIAIENKLQAMQGITPKDMMTLQNDVYSPTAADMVPLLLRYTDESKLDVEERTYLAEVKGWNFYANAESKAPTVYQTWMDSLESVIWKDEFNRIAIPKPLEYERYLPNEQTLVEALLRDSAFRFIDDINTSDTETLNVQVVKAFKLAAASLKKEENENGLLWWKHKNPTVYHLLKNSVMPFARPGLNVGGWSNTINALTHSHGPSWRMIVHLTPETEAYGVYPGGQNGNPGSKYYDTFVDTWVAGKYYKLWMMKPSETNDKRIKWTMTFSKA
jgi:penicillin G amidase